MAQPYDTNVNYPQPADPNNNAISQSSPNPLKQDPAEEAAAQSFEWDWPTTHQRRELLAIAGSDEAKKQSPKWSFTKWAWRSNGKCGATKDRPAAERRKCLGTYRCTGCARLTRPKTDSNARKAQLNGSCFFCHHVLMDLPCSDGFIYHFDQNIGGQRYHVWEHEGTHVSHPHPPDPSTMSSAQDCEVDRQVARRHDASAHALRTGDTGPGSKPLAEIAPALANARKSRYQVEQSKLRQGLTSTVTKGGLSVLQSFDALVKKLDSPFFIDSRLHGPIFITCQTPFMEQLIGEASLAWIQDSSTGDDSSGRHGFVTDGDHSFFRSGQLLATCVFSQVLNSWAPVLYTFMNGADTNHHRPHFHHVNEGVVNSTGKKFDPKLLAHVRMATSFL